MQVGIFGPVAYLAPDVPRGFPLAPRYYDPSHGVQCMENALRVFELADDLGFDHVGVAEHHYTARQLTPDPTLFAAALTQRIRNAKIAVLGLLLPMLDPVRVAEQFAMLDGLSHGRLMPGVFRGTPNELIVYHSNPAESRARYEEAVRLILKCWTEPEPFGWEGVHYRYRSIAVWPRPVQQPTPPLLVSGNSLDSAQFAGTHRLHIGFSLSDVAAKAAHVARYKAAAATAGWKPRADHVLSRYLIHVAPTDEKAREQMARYASEAPLDGRRLAYLQAMMATGAGRPRPPGAALPTSGAAQPTPGAVQPTPPTLSAARPGPGAGPPTGAGFPTLIGGPDTLLKRMTEIVKTTGVGRFDLIFTGDRLPDELGIASLKLFAKEMLPTLRELDAQVSFDAIEPL